MSLSPAKVTYGGTDFTGHLAKTERPPAASRAPFCRNTYFHSLAALPSWEEEVDTDRFRWQAGAACSGQCLVRASARGQSPCRTLSQPRMKSPDPVRITILVPEPVFPATHGGRVDRYRRIRGLRQLGAQVQLVVWTDSKRPQTESSTRHLQDVGVEVISVARVRRLRKFLRFDCTGRLDSFMPSPGSFNAVLEAVTSFDPRLILADGLETSIPAKSLAARLGVPLAYRSQNIEHVYWEWQARLSHFPQSLPLLLGARNLGIAERQFRSDADIVLDIADEDRRYGSQNWSESKSITLPPTWLADDAVPTSASAQWDISFTGGLAAPNNVAGIQWFLSEVLPELRRNSPTGLRIAFAGSSPSSHLLHEFRRHDVECVPNPGDIDAIRRSSRVLINPVRHASGVNIKMIEMIATGIPIVSTEAGTRGLPAALLSLITIARSPLEFAESIRRHLTSAPVGSASSARRILSESCGVDSLRPLLDFARR